MTVTHQGKHKAFLNRFGDLSSLDDSEELLLQNSQVLTLTLL
jgi:hypothetical protein